MVRTSLKEKLHEYIDHADDKKVKAIYTLVENDMEEKRTYDEVTLNSFRETSKAYASGKMKGYTLEASMKRVKKKLGKK